MKKINLFLAIALGILAVSCAKTEFEKPDYLARWKAEKEAEEEAEKRAKDPVWLNGKTVLFIGNQYVYGGGCVIEGGQTQEDKGMFYNLCKTHGENVKVIDCCYKDAKLADFAPGAETDLLAGVDLTTVDIVFMSENGSDNSSLLSDVQAIKSRFTGAETKFYYLSNQRVYEKAYVGIKQALPKLEADKVTVLEWGKLAFTMWKGKLTIEGSAIEYAKNSFIESDTTATVLPNPLSGYITAAMAYAGAGNRFQIDTLKYDFCNNVINFDTYIAQHYTGGETTNFKDVFNSSTDMKGILTEVGNYRKYGYSPGGGQTYEIGTQEEFVNFLKSDAAYAVAGDTFLLTADIDMSGASFSSAAEFSAQFDGQGHTISNWTFTKSHRLFKMINEGATVKNLTVEGTADEGLSTGNDSPIISNINSGTVENVTISVNMSRKAGNGYGAYTTFGTICHTNNGTVKNCTNTGNLEIVNASGEDKGCFYKGAMYFGGLVGINKGTVTGCKNTGSFSITTDGGKIANGSSGIGTGDEVYPTYIGGVVACNLGGTVENCSNEGQFVFKIMVCKVTDTGGNSVETATYVGGVVAGSVADQETGTEGSVIKCSATGKIIWNGLNETQSTGALYIGNVSGYGKMTNCTDAGTLSLTKLSNVIKNN